MATPHVAGAAALMLAACPSLSTTALKDRLLANVDPVPNLAGKTTTGGRLNVDKAVRSCGSTPPSGSGTMIFASTSAPTIYYAPVAIGLELGVKFRSDVSGSITAVRFYKGAGDTAAHTGSLWSGAGQLLATGTFTNETASGWQQLTLATPVPITANATYVASYHTTGGYFADYNYFQ